MNTILSLGELDNRHSQSFFNQNYEVEIIRDEADFRVLCQEETPIFVMISELNYDEALFEFLNEQKIPFLIFCEQEKSFQGYEAYRFHAFIYLSEQQSNFSENAIKAYQHFIERDVRGFLPKLLKESERLYHGVLNETSSILIVCSIAGEILFANSKAESYLGDCSDRNLFELLDSILIDDVKKMMNRVEKSRTPEMMRCNIILEEVFIPIRWGVASFDSYLPESFLFSGEDITDLMELRKKDFIKSKSLLALNDQLEVMNKSLDQFSSMISHDLKNQLNRIKGLARILNRNESDTLSKDGKELLVKIDHNIEDMVITINRILDFARSKNSPLQVSSFSLLNLFSHLKDQFSQAVEDIDGEIELECDDISVIADRICLTQVFENLISNSIKYRHPQRNLKITITVDDLGADILVSLQDNGLGIKKEDHEKLFDQYYRNKEDSLSAEGHGIGLHTVKTLLAAHGGVIYSDPEVNLGAQFMIQFPKSQK